VKKRIIVFCIGAFIVGFFLAYVQGKPTEGATAFHTENVAPSDTITLSSGGDIYTLSQNNTTQITHQQNLTEPVVIKDTIAAIEKTTNYASLILLDASGTKIKTLFNGDSSSIDTMSWITDPSTNPEETRIAYVSDKDKAQTNVPDNALYVYNLTTGKSTNIAQPDPYSGGIAHPIFDPVDGNILLYDYYQYDPQTLMPYATIEQYDNRTGLITTRTFENQNAYQESLSPDGTKLLYLERNTDLPSVTVYIADFDTKTGLSNMHPLFTGDLAYPVFSNTKNHLYILQATGNKGYNLLTATIQNNTLINIKTVVSGNALLGNSSYAIHKK